MDNGLHIYVQTAPAINKLTLLIGLFFYAFSLG